MTRVLYLDDSHERVFELAARHIRTLASVERSHALEDFDDMEALLRAVDPVDLQLVGQELELLRSLYRVAPIQIATEPRAAEHPPHQGDGSRSADSVSASAAFFPESRRV